MFLFTTYCVVILALIRNAQSILGEGESINTPHLCCVEECVDEKKASFEECRSESPMCITSINSYMDQLSCGNDGADWDLGACQGVAAGLCYGEASYTGSAGGKYVVAGYWFNFYEAQHYCRYRHGTELASIHSYYDYYFTAMLCFAAHEYYESAAGGNDPINNFDGCWLGLYQFGQAGASISGGGAGDCEGPSEPDTNDGDTGCSKAWYWVDGSKVDLDLTDPELDLDILITEDKGTKLGTFQNPSFSMVNDYTESQNCMTINVGSPSGLDPEWNDFSCTEGETIFPSRGSGWVPHYAICNGPKYYKKPAKSGKDLSAADYIQPGIESHVNPATLESNEPRTIHYKVEISQSVLVVLMIFALSMAVLFYYQLRLRNQPPAPISTKSDDSDSSDFEI